MTRTDAILLAIRRRVEKRRAELDSADDLRGLTIELKFSPDCLEPREIDDKVQRGERRKETRPSAPHDVRRLS